MFSLANGIYQTYFAPPVLNVLIVGASGSGKTTLLERCKVTQFATSTKEATAHANATTNNGNNGNNRRGRGGGGQQQQQQPLATIPKSVFFPSGELQARGSSSAVGIGIGGPASAVEGTATASASASALSAATNNVAATSTHRVKRPSKKHLTQRGKSASSSSTASATDAAGSGSGNGGSSGTRRQSWLCPAPPKYADAAAALSGDDEGGDDDDDNERELVTVIVGGGSSKNRRPLLGDRQASFGNRPIPGMARRSTALSSLKSVELQEMLSDDGYDSITSSEDENDDDDQEDETEPLEKGSAAATASALSAPEPKQLQFDLKKGAQMLPLSRIRPTIGMNLAKNLKICGTHCNFMDVGGRMSKLWERYYGDCHAVIFVWKINDRLGGKKDGKNDDGDDDDSDGPPPITPLQQLGLLERVRSAIPDDVPLLVLGHLFAPEPKVQVDTLYTTSALLPHYHNPHSQALCIADAATGEGVRHALEWVVPLAARYEQQLFRAYYKT